MANPRKMNLLSTSIHVRDAHIAVNSIPIRKLNVGIRDAWVSASHLVAPLAQRHVSVDV